MYCRFSGTTTNALSPVNLSIPPTIFSDALLLSLSYPDRPLPLFVRSSSPSHVKFLVGKKVCLSAVQHFVQNPRYTFTVRRYQSCSIGIARKPKQFFLPCCPAAQNSRYCGYCNICVLKCSDQEKVPPRKIICRRQNIYRKIPQPDTKQTTSI